MTGSRSALRVLVLLFACACSMLCPLASSQRWSPFDRTVSETPSPTNTPVPTTAAPGDSAEPPETGAPIDTTPTGDEVPVDPSRTPTAAADATPSATSSSPFTRAEDLPAERIRDLWSAPDGRLWVATEAGLFERKEAGWNRLSDRGAVDILGDDGAGGAWVIMEDHATIAMTELGGTGDPAWTVYGGDEGWSPPDPVSGPRRYGGIVRDRDEHVWLAAGEGAALRLDAEAGAWGSVQSEEMGFPPVDPAKDQAYAVTDVALDGAGRVWVAACLFEAVHPTGGGARWFDGDAWRGADAVSSSCVHDLAVDLDGTLWVGQRDTVVRYAPNGDGRSEMELPPWDRYQSAGAIALDGEQRPWVTLLRGGGAYWHVQEALYLLEGDGWTAIYDPDESRGMDGFPIGFNVDGVGFGPDGSGWICTDGMVYGWLDGELVEIGTPLTADNMGLWHLAVDGEGRVWVGRQGEAACDSGLWFYEPAAR